AGMMDHASEAIADATSDPPVDAVAEVGCPDPNLCALKAALVHRYQFDGTGTVATDSVGGANGTLMNTQLNGSGGLTLAGGTSNQFVDLPNGIVSPLTNATFEVWVTWSGGAAWQRIFDFGDSTFVNMQRNASTTFYLTPEAAANSSYTGPSVLLSA